MGEALKILAGAYADGLSARTVARLKQAGAKEYQQWNDRDRGKDQWVYIWAMVFTQDSERNRQSSVNWSTSVSMTVVRNIFWQLKMVLANRPELARSLAKAQIPYDECTPVSCR